MACSMFRCLFSLESIQTSIALLRRHSWLPIIFTGRLAAGFSWSRARLFDNNLTVRTKSQGGLFPDNEAVRSALFCCALTYEPAKAYFAMLHFALRLGCEYIDLERSFCKHFHALLREKS